MKGLPLISIFLVMGARALFSQALAEDLAAIGSFFPRLEGSQGEKRCVAYIESRLGALGVPFTPFDFSDSDFEHSFSGCLRVNIAGKRPDTLILAVPLDQPPDAEEGKDGAVSIALALEVISRTREAPPPVSLIVLFLGAEFGDTDEYPMGSRLFLRDFQPAYRTAVMYLDLREVPARVLVRGGGRGIVTPYWLMDRTVAALRAAGVPYMLRSNEGQLFRLRAASEQTIIEPYLRAGYPSVELDGDSGPADPARDASWMAAFPSFVAGLLREVAAGIPEDWDRHYLLFQAGERSLLITEKAYVIILIAALSAMLLYALAFREGIRRYARSLWRNLPALLPVMGISFLFLFAGTLVLEGIQALRGFPALWSYAPVQFLLLKACFAVFLYAALYNAARRLPFPRNGTFYSAAALFILLADIAVLAMFNVSFTYYFLWAFLFVFLSALVRPRIAKLLLFLPAPFWGVRGLVAVFTLPALPFCHFLLLSPIWGNLFIAAACLPFVLAVLRLGLIFPGRGILRRHTREYVLAAVLFAGSAFLGVHLAIFSPFSPVSPQPVSVTQTLAVGAAGEVIQDTLSVTSPAPLGTLTVAIAGQTRELAAKGTSISLPLPLPAVSPVKISQDSSAFFSQRTVTLGVTMPGSPRAIAATLASDEDFILFDCSFPFIRESANRYRILIGSFAPNPLPLQLTLPAGGTFTLEMDMAFDLPLIGAQVGARGDTRTATRVRVSTSVGVKT